MGVRKSMRITFDPAKRETTLRERGLDFAEAAEVFDDARAELVDLRFDYPEPRTVSFGYLRGRLVVVVWTLAEGGRRVISMRKANDREQRRYG